MISLESNLGDKSNIEYTCPISCLERILDCNDSASLFEGILCLETNLEGKRNKKDIEYYSNPNWNKIQNLDQNCFPFCTDLNLN
mmetsp:Transcript_9034/g.10319  ORF Transcript_9034/g.10319 Transcript_9034/m.10319 type:complete len:84 (+) Transcript_9034:161-412(+)